MANSGASLPRSSLDRSNRTSPPESRSVSTEPHELSRNERDDLIRQHLPLVTEIAKKVLAVHESRHTTLEDLRGYGAIGLIEAASRYKPHLNSSFAAYAYVCIRGRIIDGIASCNWYSRWQARSWRTTKDRYERTNEPSVGDKLSNKPKVFYADAMDHMGGPSVRTWTERELEEDGAREAERIAALLPTLPARERRMIDLVYFESLSIAEAGSRMGVTRSRASRIHLMAITLLREAAQSDDREL